jgi:hypothetical protein
MALVNFQGSQSRMSAHLDRIRECIGSEAGVLREKALGGERLWVRVCVLITVGLSGVQVHARLEEQMGGMHFKPVFLCASLSNVQRNSNGNSGMDHEPAVIYGRGERYYN